MPIESIETALWGDESNESYWLNPRRIRGSDFLMRWSQGVWSEMITISAINESQKYFAIPYGASSVAPNDPKKAELYFDRLDKVNAKDMKRPDILIYSIKDRDRVESEIKKLGGLEELPFTEEPNMGEILKCAILAIECENSLWIAKQMPDYGQDLRPMNRLNGNLGLPKNAKTPTVIIKDEDLNRIKTWQDQIGVPIHSWQIFYDLGIGISLNDAVELISNNKISKTEQKFAESNGNTTTKTIYKIYHNHAYSVGKIVTTPQLKCDTLIDKNGHVMPYVKFEGGKMVLDSNVITKFDEHVK